ncbi:MFS domain-containing protein [Mycena venus]|uniref:MFS domain-containing protein n=1 Tax=Mycena venus TaxID=2733690 RepID=A0A8H7CJC3_9AGAR|nr:MFS domain-containing protein [Mycena venus]
MRAPLQTTWLLWNTLPRMRLSRPPPSHLISPITHAHVSGHSSSFSTSRHQDAFSISTHKSEITVSPSPSAVSSDSYFEPKGASRKDLRLRYRLASVIFLYFLNGWGDGVTGTALPYFRAAFHLSYMTSSLLFVATMIGFMSGTLLVPRIMNFLGLFYLCDHKLAFLPISPWRIALSRPKPNTIGHSASQARYVMLVLASLGPPVTFVMMGSKQGFPTMFMAYIVIAFARALLTASLNVFLSERRSKCLGYAFGVWSTVLFVKSLSVSYTVLGFGAVASPLIFQATAGAGLPWAHFYFGSLASPSCSSSVTPLIIISQVLAAASWVFLGITFYPTAREFAMDRKHALAEARSPPPTSDSDGAPDTSEATSIPPPTPSASPLRLIATMPYQWADFVVYPSVLRQGLVVQYLLAERQRKPKDCGIRYIRFLGRHNHFSRRLELFLSQNFIYPPQIYNSMLSVKVCTIHCTISSPDPYTLGLALSMQLLIMLINSNIENAVSASLIGAFFVEVRLPSMAIISAAGSLGNAIFPFVTGVITTKYSMRCWSYMTVTQAAVLFCTWYLFPTRQPLRRAVARPALN